MARRRGSPAAIGFVVVLVVAALVALGLFFGDRYAAGRAERETAARLQSQLGTPTAPDVDVEGWPFLTQVVGRHLGAVHVVADDVPKSSRSEIPVAHVDVVLSDVTTDDWFETMTAAHAEGRARLEYSALSEAAGVPLTYVGGGRVEVKTSTSVLGLDLDARVTGTPALDVRAQTVTLADPDVRVAGLDLPGASAAAVVSALTKPIPVRGPLFGLRLTELTPGDDGLHVVLQGDDVAVSR
jgi:LmeA-like phospholipid-binding